MKKESARLVIFYVAAWGRLDHRPRWLFWKILAHFSLQK